MLKRACSVFVKLAVLSLSFVAAAAAGCGSEDGAAAYFGTTIGATWNYAVTPASGSGYTETTQNTSGSSSTLLRTSTLSNGTPSTTSFALDSDGISITGGTSMTSQYAYAPPCLLLPSNTTPGFSTSSTSTETGQGYTTQTVAVAITIDGIETVVVPAGTFSALKVTRLFSEPTVSYNVKWYASGVGCVKTVNENDLQAVQTTWELTSYNIP